MGGYLSIVGNRYYIISKDKSECAVFDSYGTLITLQGCISDCSLFQDVDIISIVSSGAVSNKTDIYFNGEHRISYHPKYKIVSKLSEFTKPYMGMLFCINHEEIKEKNSQVIMVYKSNTWSADILDTLLDERNLTNTWEVV